MTRPRLLDLFCGAGGAARGYQRAGFYVVGVDIKPQPRYAGDEFIQADAMMFPLDGYDVIHASPPCQAYSVTKHSWHHTQRRMNEKHPELIPPTRTRLRANGVPYVLENVIGAPLEAPVLLCGTMFGLATPDIDGTPLFLRRHRIFESSEFLAAPTFCICADLKARGFRVGGVYGGGSENRDKAARRAGGYTPGKQQRAELIDADWMTLAELSQSIPPAYTEHIGRALLSALKANVA